jgi:primase-polymerase (primpol)-like protein
MLAEVQNQGKGTHAGGTRPGAILTPTGSAATCRSYQPALTLVLPKKIPEVLKGIPNWLVWKYAWNPNKKRKDGSGVLGEYDKPPFNARTRALADTTNPATWCAFDTAWAAYQSGHWNGIGIVLTEEMGIVGIDLDRCVNYDTDVIDDWVQEIVDQIDSYAEISPSGTGVRILAHGRKPAGRCVKGSFEIYGKGRYLTITGHHLRDTPTGVEERPEQIAAVRARTFGPAGQINKEFP